MVYISITVGASLVAFVLSLFAVSHDWHLRTNLKGLLWTGAALIFLLMLLFTRQVANIMVLDELEIPKDFAHIGSLQTYNNTVRLGNHYEVDTSGKKIKIKEIFREPSGEILKQLENTSRLFPAQEDLDLEIYPTFDRIFINTEEGTFLFNLYTYSYREEIRKNSYYVKLKKAYLCSYKLLEGLYPIPVSVLNLSNCVDKEGSLKVGLRQIEDKLIVFIQDSYAVVQTKQDGGLELIEKQVNGLKGYSRSLRDRDKIFKIPLIPIQDISIEERIRLTIDLNYSYYHVYSGWRHQEDFCSRSVVDIDGDKISYCLLNEDEIARFDVVEWDDEYVYCKFRDERLFIFLEQMFGQVTEYNPWFIQDGKLYAYENWKLLVFDVRSDRIRKLGHFQRINEDFTIQGIEVLDNGNILLCTGTEKRILTKSADPNRKYDDYFSRKGYLSLLKNPE